MIKISHLYSVDYFYYLWTKTNGFLIRIIPILMRARKRLDLKQTPRYLPMSTYLGLWFIPKNSSLKNCWKKLSSLVKTHLGIKMSGQNNIFESEPDPRIKWALDILGNDGVEPVSVIDHYLYPFAAGTLAFSGRLIRQYYYRRPLSAGFPWTVGITLGAMLGGPDFFWQI